jgi:4-carboxymuconolactone decarboxylase
MMETSEPQAYIDAMAKARGRVPAYHSIMSAQDYAVLKATNGLAQATLGEQRRLDARTKELLCIMCLTVLGAGVAFLAEHVRRALGLGATPDEVLEVLEIALPFAGIVAFLIGFEAWCEVTQPEGIEPTIGSDGATGR